ncbi:hypothetical protein Poli38472_011491 [Pythium oligandrum]|uniref:Peptidase S1 domain-containing protein n=1 Tax=Pythium oligandrum TaxID=41045 RepID=A0A8K1CJ78_PYTOL|nr:hypothetical protein Poli38472_011491 [Pythium oligandrum]|eukprot:TMW64611.1 hypothetical protein Poli38472_011491 [Pythium oligandrum]
MRVSVIHQVIYLDGSRCQHAVCALPLDVEARKVFTGPTSWGFLLQHDVAQGNYRLLGLGGSEGTNTDGIWGFSWLPQLLTSSVLRNNGVHDVQTVTVAHKEVAGDPVDDDKATFIAGFLETEDSQTSCTGTVVASRYVLTAASCFKRGDFKWIILDRLDTLGESGERIKIKKKIPHPHHVDGTHWYDFMLVELEKPTSRTPIGFVDTNTTFTEGTVFGYKELIDRYGRYYQTYELRAADTKLLTLPQCVGWMDVEMDETMMCVGGKLTGALCTGDNGGPVVVTTENKTKLLYALVTVGGDCGRTSLYGIVSVVFSVADWIHAHLDQKTCLNGRTTRLTGTRRLILA